MRIDRLAKLTTGVQVPKLDASILKPTGDDAFVGRDSHARDVEGTWDLPN